MTQEFEQIFKILTAKEMSARYIDEAKAHIAIGDESDKIEKKLQLSRGAKREALKKLKAYEAGVAESKFNLSIPQDLEGLWCRWQSCLHGDSVYKTKIIFFI
jgi:hypothetical protein